MRNLKKNIISVIMITIMLFGMSGNLFVAQAAPIDRSDYKTIKDAIDDGTVEKGDFLEYRLENGAGTNDGNFAVSADDTGYISEQQLNAETYNGGWQLFYDTTDKIEIISSESVANLYFGQEARRGTGSSNNAANCEAANIAVKNSIRVLNEISQKYINPDFARDGRSVGSDRDNINGENNTNIYQIMGINAYIEISSSLDAYHVGDQSQLETLGLIDIGEPYWLASRAGYSTTNSASGWNHYRGISFISSTGTYQDSHILEATYGYQDGWSGKIVSSLSNDNGVRPVITLKDNIYVDISDSSTDGSSKDKAWKLCVIEDEKETILKSNSVIVEGINGTEFINSYLVVEEKQLSDEEKYNYNLKLENDKILNLFDITIIGQDGKPIKEFPNGIQIKIPVADKYNDYTGLKAIYVDDGGNIEILTAKTEDGYIVFTTDHLSQYGIIGTEKVNPGANDPDTSNPTTRSPKTGDINLFAIMTMAAAAMIGMIIPLVANIRKKQSITQRYR